MSSNSKMPFDNTNKKQKKTSTANKLHFAWMGRLLYIILTIDIVVLLCVVGGYIYYSEVQEFGSFAWSHAPTVKPTQVQLNIFNTCVWVVVCVEIIVYVTNLLFGIYTVRRQLKPLDELAAMAGQLGNQTKDAGFDESMVHSLEDAISKIMPTGPEGTLHTTDRELKGLETAINKLLERMRDSYKQQTQFVSDASHELRTPIAVIQGYVNMLDRWGKQDEQILEESIDAIKNESEHMKKLVEQLLFLARGDSGRNQFKLEKVNLKELAAEVYEESLMIDENHVYRYEAVEEPVEIIADPDMLKQASRVLVDNAAKYTEPKEIIKLGCGWDSEGNAILYVQDNGNGMENEDIRHMFERFYRASEARESKSGGTGLGLSIAQWIVGRHYGHFNVKSMKDIGTRITIVLPQEQIKTEWEQNI